MPTASKLAAAVAFALVAFFTLQTLVPHLPEGTQLGYAREISAAIGFAVGLLMLGRAAGGGYKEPVSTGPVTWHWGGCWGPPSRGVGTWWGSPEGVGPSGPPAAGRCPDGRSSGWPRCCRATCRRTSSIGCDPWVGGSSPAHACSAE